MKKLVVLPSIFCGMIIVSYLGVFKDQVTSDVELAANTIEESKVLTPAGIAPKEAVNQQKLDAEIPLVPVKTLLNPKSKIEIRRASNLSYHDEWCQISELKETERAFAEAEIAEWKRITGGYGYILKDEESIYQYDDEDFERVAYMEIPKAELLSYIKDNNHNAMFAALDRPDFWTEDKKNIALDLIALGYTGKAIWYLVHFETIAANTYYDKGDKTNPAIRQHLVNALTYAVYSLNLYDPIGLFQFTLPFFDHIGSEDKLKPEEVLSKVDYEKLYQQVESFTASVERARNNRGLPPIERELNRVAKYQIDEDIGVVLGAAPHLAPITDKLSVNSPLFERNRCKNNLIALHQLGR